MKNYTKIPFNRIKDIESYVRKKLKAGHVIIQILVDDDEKEIDKLISYANDKECLSYFNALTDSDMQLKTSVIVENMDLYYAFKSKDENSDVYICDIDIENDSQNVIDFGTFTKEFKNMEQYYSGENFKFRDDGSKLHYEFFVSTEKGDISNFGGSLEVDFATEWMKEHNYYSEED